MKDKREREEDELKKKKKRTPKEIKVKDEESDDDAGWETVKKGSSMPMVSDAVHGYIKTERNVCSILSDT